jgi:peptidoglycan/LPS O-acetylase OafA/YrhL
MSHYWSLGVEEQFYSFWPVVLQKLKNPYRSLSLFIIIFLIVKVIFRLIEIRWGYHIPYTAITVNRFDCMAIGGVGAYIYFTDQRKILNIICSLPAQLISWGVIFLAAINKFHTISLLDNEIFSVVSVVLIINVCSNPRTVIRMDNRVMDFLGKISFGIYVYHPLIIFFDELLLNHLAISLTAKIILTFISVPLMTILVAYISYEFYEKKFILLKERYSKIQSTSTKYSF